MASGFTPAGLGAAGAVLRAGVDDRLWPGAVALAGTGTAVEGGWVFGDAEHWARVQRPMATDTVFDLASLTKVLVTTPAILLLVERGELRLTDQAARYLPGLDPRIEIRQLLLHIAGLPPTSDLTRVRSTGELVSAAAAIPLDTEPGTAVAYSDLGFIALGGVITAVTGQPLADFAVEQLCRPAGMAARYCPPEDWLARTAATELVDGRPVLGTVHDENAAAAGGVAGHAGLFGTAEDVQRAIGCWLPGGPVLSERTRQSGLRDQTTGLDGHRGFGWTCRGDDYDILSGGWGPRAVSHTGFTGTSAALDPDTGRWAVLLTNAVHFGRGRPEVLAARRRFHSALVQQP